ncbi:MAG: hypothetical protein AAFR69_02515 [Pseudomonadota bacterium]
MKNMLLCAAAAMTVSSMGVTAAQAQTQTGRQLDVITDPIPGRTEFNATLGEMVEVREVVGIFWDERCASVEYTFNSNVPANPGTPNEIAPAVLADVVQQGLDRWNENPSSYIEMNVTDTRDLGARPRVGGDFINEVTFFTDPGFTALASSPSTSLAADTTFNVGDDIDEDGDSDVYDPVAEGINVCTDIDGDGDIEFPAGDYAAGTILDNDVQFGAGVPWELEPNGNLGTLSLAFDIDAVSTHEFGHSHGLSHSLVNQFSDNDGESATMFPFIDGGDAVAEAAPRTPSTDDLAASAFIYQEGVGTQPITQLQSGDVAFADAYDVIEGTVEFDDVFTAGIFGPGTPAIPAVGAGVFMETGGTVFSMAYSGSALVFDAPIAGAFQITAPESFPDGNFAVPVLKGSVYRASLEALDGMPAAGGNISTTAFISQLLGLTIFPEEGWTRRDSGLELNPGASSPIPSFRDGIDFTVNNELLLTNSGALDFLGFTLAGVNEAISAEVFDRDVVLGAIDDGLVPVAGTIFTGNFDQSFVSEFIEARLSLGRITGDPGAETLEVFRTVRRDRNFVGQDRDLARFNFGNPRGLARQLRRLLNRFPDAQVVLEVEANDMLTRIGDSGNHTNFVGLSQNFPAGPVSFLSTDRSPFARPAGGTTTFLMELRFVDPDAVAPAPPPMMEAAQ